MVLNAPYYGDMVTETTSPNTEQATSLWRRIHKIHKSGTSLAYGWEHVRDCHPETADKWLTVWQNAEPDSVLVLSQNKPKGKAAK